MPSSSAPASPPAAAIERWRCPAALRAKSAVTAAVLAVIAMVFFPLWFAIPVAVACAAWGIGMGVGGTSVTVDKPAGRLELRVGPVARRIRLADVTAVLVEEAKVSISRATGVEISLYVWRKSPLDRLLRVPAVGSEVGHAISSAVALAQAAEPAGASRPAGRTSARTRSRLATALLGVAGAAAIGSALVVRVHWHNPVMTVAAVILALALGVSGVAYLLVAAWIWVNGRAPGVAASQ